MEFKKGQLVIVDLHRPANFISVAMKSHRGMVGVYEQRTETFGGAKLDMVEFPECRCGDCYDPDYEDGGHFCFRFYLGCISPYKPKRENVRCLLRKR